KTRISTLAIGFRMEKAKNTNGSVQLDSTCHPSHAAGTKLRRRYRNIDVPYRLLSVNDPSRTASFSIRFSQYFAPATKMTVIAASNSISKRTERNPIEGPLANTNCR